MTARPRGRGDAGSASVWVLACCALLGVVGAVVVIRTCAVLARHRAEGAADLGALAGALRIGLGGGSCEAAARIVIANGARLVACRVRPAPDGRSGTVSVEAEVEVRLPFAGSESITATARAGRLAGPAQTRPTP